MADLVIEGLNKRYGSVQALKDMSLTARGGEIFGFVGSNGAGKSTTMRIALGVVAADSGTVSFAGLPLDLAARRRVGYMPEERGLYPKMKVGDQLTYLARLHGLSPQDAHTSMERWTERLGVAERRGDEVQKLSLGNQQRVQLAAALVHNPDLLILDEPFSGLDPVAVEVMSDVLRECADAGVPTLFSSHQLDLVERLCDRVGIVRHGTMLACGTIEELRTTPEVDVDVVVRGAPPTWAERFAQTHPTVTLISRSGDTSRLRLPHGDDGVRAALVSAATAAGTLVQLADRRASLTELFRDAVSEEISA
ncbi:MAG: ATP-binding cassette domain-containing protein [Bowdeniella nasicola]|nr:ATP-binding cassette domain-containing protein [Bowdeniella nasicola]